MDFSLRNLGANFARHQQMMKTLTWRCFDNEPRPLCGKGARWRKISLTEGKIEEENEIESRKGI